MNDRELAVLEGRIELKGLDKASGQLASVNSEFARTATAAGVAEKAVSKAGRGSAAASAAWEKQRQSLVGLGRAVKYGTLAVGGLAAAGVVAGIKMNAQWESQQASFSTLLGSMKKAEKFTERLRSVSAKSPLRLTEYAEGAKLLLGFGMNAKKVIPTLAAVNRAVVATGKGEQEMMSVVRALGQMQAKGKGSAEELNQLAEAGVPVQKILKKQLELTGEQVANIGEEGVKSGKIIRAIATGWNEMYGPAYKNAAGTWVVQTARLRKGFEQLLRLGTEHLFENLTTNVLPELNGELSRATDTLSNPRLTNTQKLDRLAGVFESLAEKIGKFAERGADGFAKALDRLLPIFMRAVRPITGALMRVLPNLIAKLSPVVAKGAASLAGAFVKGFTQAPILGKLLIGGWLFSKLGGFAAIRAAGATAGQSLATGTAAGMTANSGKLSGAARGWMATIGSTVKSVGIGALIAGSVMSGMELLDRQFGPKADDLEGRLQQLQQQGAGVRGTIGRMFDAVPGADKINAWSGPMGGFVSLVRDSFTSFSRSADEAGRLDGILTQIQNARPGQVSALRAEGLQILRNLGLSRELAAETRKRLNAKPEQFTNVQAGIDRLAGGQITRLQDIRRIARQNSVAAAEAYGKGSPEWRSAAARNMNATIMAIRAGMNQGVIATRTGKERIRQILARRDLVTGHDPGGIARGFKRGWLETGRITNKGIRRIVDSLDQMPGPAQKKTRAMLVAMARALERGGKLPEGSMSRLRSALVAKFGEANVGIEKKLRSQRQALQRNYDAMGNLVAPFASKVKSGSKRAGDAMADLGRDSQKAARTVKRAVSSISPVARVGFTDLASATNTALHSFGVRDKDVSLGYRSGGAVPFRGRGRSRAVMLSPGERVDYEGKSWMVPGRPVARDSVRARLPVGARVYTFDGQVRMAMGERPDQALRNQLPHFAAGGSVGDRIPKVRMSGPRQPARIGSGALGMVRSAAVKYLRKNQSLIPRGPIVAIGRALQRMGYEIGEHPAFGGVAPVHSTNSWHYKGRALDINDDVNPRGGSEMASLDWLYGQLKKIPHVELLWRVPDHFDHLHFAQRKGGTISRFRRGGRTTVTGRATWFGGGRTAGGSDTSRPGVSLNPGTWNSPLTRMWRDASLAGNPYYARVSVGGKSAVLPITDMGPADWTGNRIDVTVGGLAKMGFTTGNFPSGTVGKAVVLGTRRDRARAVEKAKGNLSRAKRLWRSIGRHGTTGAGKKRARIVGRNARAQLKAARNFNLDKAAGHARVVRGMLPKAYQGVKNAVKNAGVPASQPRGRTPLSALPSWARGLPSGIKRMLRQPGLSWQGRRDILERAAGLAESTPGTADDVAAQRGILALERGRRKRAQKRYFRTSRLLGESGYTAERRKRLGKAIRRDERLLAKHPKSDAVRKRLAANKRTAARWDRLLGGRDRSLATLNDSESAIRDAKSRIGELGGSGGGSDLADELKALREEIAKQTATLERGFSADAATLRQLLTDTMSGQLAGRAGPARSYGFSPAVNF